MRVFLCLVGLALVTLTAWSIDNANARLKAGLAVLKDQGFMTPQKFMKYIQGDKNYHTGDMKHKDNVQHAPVNEMQSQDQNIPSHLHLGVNALNLPPNQFVDKQSQNNLENEIGNDPPMIPPVFVPNFLSGNQQMGDNMAAGEQRGQLGNQQDNDPPVLIPKNLAPNIPQNQPVGIGIGEQSHDQAIGLHQMQHAPAVLQPENAAVRLSNQPFGNNLGAVEQPRDQVNGVQQVQQNLPSVNAAANVPVNNPAFGHAVVAREQLQAQVNNVQPAQQVQPDLEFRNVAPNTAPNYQPVGEHSLGQANGIQGGYDQLHSGNIPDNLQRNNQPLGNNMGAQKQPQGQVNGVQQAQQAPHGFVMRNTAPNNQPLGGGIVVGERPRGEVNGVQADNGRFPSGNVPANVPLNNQPFGNNVGVLVAPQGQSNDIQHAQQAPTGFVMRNVATNVPLNINPVGNNIGAAEQSLGQVNSVQQVQYPQLGLAMRNAAPNLPQNNQPFGDNVGAQSHNPMNGVQQVLPSGNVPPNVPLNNQPIGNNGANNYQYFGDTNNVQQHVQNEQPREIPRVLAPNVLSNNPAAANNVQANEGPNHQIDSMQVQNGSVNSNPVQTGMVPALNVAQKAQQNQQHLRADESASNMGAVVPLEKEDVPVIISWNQLGGSEDYDIICKTFQCHLTHKHEVRHQHDLLGFFFYGPDFGTDGLPLPRKPGHLWSIIHEESPRDNDWLFCAKDAMTMFNLTATFRRESHYPFPTMWLKDEKELTSMEYVMSLERKNQLRKEGLAPIVFVHSDCNTPSDRSHYMRLLQKYIKIDSYSTCEHNKKFPSEDLTFNLNGVAPLTSSSFYQLLAQYKFAFAFENAVCDDYITEKFWRPLHLGVVPIVFGSPKIEDFAPSNMSFINIRDFQSVKEVADYITFLDTHDDAYSKYVDFKRTGITNPTLRSELDRRDWGHGKVHGSQFGGFQCFICEKLHNLKSQMTSGQPVEQWQGRHDHYGCPAPKLFDEDGRYVIERNQSYESHHYAKYYLQSLRYHIDNNINIGIEEIHKFARTLQKEDKNRIGLS